MGARGPRKPLHLRAIAGMTLEEQLAGLLCRAGRLDPETARQAADALHILESEFLPDLVARRTAEILLSVMWAIGRAESRAVRVMPADNVIIDAGRRFGIREAARRLKVSPATVSRRLRGVS